ncbi:hypothetical protein BOTBODRAFT_152274 [Botryobasidium botryosum FD-172 SS1]|uniref:VPS37 C-terminal domain-containing protein n=1 Tax=Botryobasidium botryosum (strain FD-172 SS1) TaxID=930990 RepID=A0A067MVY8_BOTB1|nr:hypothetical protein BOTBODRAFT_152274 [Botryobasidium botryosum FD-172 SS1]
MFPTHGESQQQHTGAANTSLVTSLTEEFPETADLSREDIEDLLTDPTYFHAFFHSLPRVKAMFQGQSELGMANESIARRNLALQDDLYRLRSETQAAFDEAQMLQARWRELDREQKELYQARRPNPISRYTQSFLLLRLRHAATAQDELSESLASSFIRQSPSVSYVQSFEPSSSGNGNSDAMGKEVDEFVKQFKELRKTYHKRVMWSERWGAGKVSWRDD